MYLKSCFNKMLNQKPAFQMTKVDMLLRSPKGVCFLLKVFNNLLNFWLLTDKQNKKKLWWVCQTYRKLLVWRANVLSDLCFQNFENRTNAIIQCKKQCWFSPQTPCGIVEDIRMNVVVGAVVWPAGERYHHILCQGRKSSSHEFSFQFIGRWQVPEQAFIL